MTLYFILSTECIICLEELKEYITEHDCGNQYHEKCLWQWKKISNNQGCPICHYILNPECTYCAHSIRPVYRYHFHTTCCNGRICKVCYEFYKMSNFNVICRYCKIEKNIPVFKKAIIIPCVKCKKNKANHNVSSKCLHYYCKKCTEENISANKWCMLCSKHLEDRNWKRWFHK
ncbi:uncharacterized protein LOC126893581 isoform X1 [Daktulosphaira vitifoliae]|uniref:uncharacterized protein LOC126893581 isoform X1 n=1 Tax=Daktulosphaira vitifoliae TaxID=58002 RepID=UPI0021AA7F33|nr:uncharacterized protein LOC126893581 isoform X1 [Daktulosphaira vitifoliae]